MFPDIPVLLDQCAKSEHKQVLNALIKIESGGDPFVIHDNNGNSIFRSRTANEAIATAEGLVRQGHSIDMGLVQINSRNLPKLGMSISQVFEPCDNIKAASIIWGWGLKMAVDKYGEGQKATLAAVSVYNTGSLSAGFSTGYVGKVAANLGLQAHMIYSSITTSNGGDSVPVISPYNAPLSSGFGENASNVVASADAPANPRFSSLTASGF